MGVSQNTLWDREDGDDRDGKAAMPLSLADVWVDIAAVNGRKSSAGLSIFRFTDGGPDAAKFKVPCTLVGCPASTTFRSSASGTASLPAAAIRRVRDVVFPCRPIGTVLRANVPSYTD